MPGSAPRSGFRTGVLSLVVGAVIALASQLVTPIAVPLYDGVALTEPYRYLQPGAGQAGEPSSFTAEPDVAEGKSPEIVAATTEQPPQAQLIAIAGTFDVAAATTLHVEVMAVPPPTPPPPGAIVGNVYRVAVTDPGGRPLAVLSAHKPTLAMRSPGSVANGAIARFADGRWETLPTEHAASIGIYTVEPDALGEFAIVDLAVGGISPTQIGLVVTGIVGAVLVALLIRFAIRRGGPRRPPPDESPRRVPSKRRPPPPPMPPSPRPPGSTRGGRRNPRTGRSR